MRKRVLGMAQREADAALAKSLADLAAVQELKAQWNARG